jgi:3-oxoacyl-[acyl-carrier protein] reductase
VHLIDKAGEQSIAVAGSVSDPDFAERFLGTAMSAFGGLDIIVNNAGYT